jgi:hypothetical protein
MINSLIFGHEKVTIAQVYKGVVVVILVVVDD